MYTTASLRAPTQDNQQLVVLLVRGDGSTETVAFSPFFDQDADLDAAAESLRDVLQDIWDEQYGVARPS